jgi:hypothetical protein
VVVVGGTTPNAFAFTVRETQDGGQMLWLVISPTGTPMYSFDDPRLAQAEAGVLNEPRLARPQAVRTLSRS